MSRWRLRPRPDRVCLETVPETGLGDSAPAFEIVDEKIQVVAQFRIEPGYERSDDSGKQQRTVGWVGRQEQLPERDPPGGRDHPGVPHLEFSCEHQT